MSNEERILEMLGQMQGDLTHIKSRLGAVEAAQTEMQADLTHIKVRLDYDVDKRLAAINEGVDAIQEAMMSKSRVEQLEDDVIVLKTAFKAMAQRITELEKAQ